MNVTFVTFENSGVIADPLRGHAILRRKLTGLKKHQRFFDCTCLVLSADELFRRCRLNLENCDVGAATRAVIGVIETIRLVTGSRVIFGGFLDCVAPSAEVLKKWNRERGAEQKRHLTVRAFESYVIFVEEIYFELSSSLVGNQDLFFVNVTIVLPSLLNDRTKLFTEAGSPSALTLAHKSRALQCLSAWEVSGYLRLWVSGDLKRMYDLFNRHHLCQDTEKFVRIPRHIGGDKNSIHRLLQALQCLYPVPRNIQGKMKKKCLSGHWCVCRFFVYLRNTISY
jgi:hypothetical protein